MDIDLRNRADWRAWLEINHSKSRGVWAVIHKKSSAAPRLTLEEAVEEAVCFGWIDSRLHTLDDDRFKLWFSPRKPNSIWSQSNKERVARLTAQGCMAPAGLAAVKAAKRNGSWNALEDIDNLVIPPDLQAALDTDRKALSNFATFTDSTKKMLLRWVDVAKRPETRRKRIDEIVHYAAQNRLPHH